MRWMLLLALIAAPALAGDQPGHVLTVHNDTAVAVNQLFVTGERRGGLRAKVQRALGKAADEQDRLAARILAPGETVTISLPGDSCRYDVSAILVDGRTMFSTNVDVCAVANWSVSSGTQR